MEKKHYDSANVLGKILFLVVLLLELVTIVFLKSSDSFFSIYLIIGLIGLYSTIKYRSSRKEKWQVFLSLFYSFAVTFSNLNISIMNINFSLLAEGGKSERHLMFESIGNGCALFLVFIGWFLISLNALHALEQLIIPNIKKFFNNSHVSKLTSKRVFFISFGIIFFVYFVHFILFSAPGTVSKDNLDQIMQIYTNRYSNHHPFYYTMLLRIFVIFGNTVFNNINFGIAAYTIFQIVIISISMAWCIRLIYEKIPSLTTMILLIIWYLLPYNLVMASSLTKDVIFSVVMTLMMTSLFKIMLDSSNSTPWDYVILIISSIAVGVFRSNGAVIDLVLMILFFLVSIKNSSCRKILFSLIIGTAVCIVLQFPILHALNVRQTELSEALSIPIQQVARVVTDGCELKEEESSVINKVLEIEEIRKEYISGISDPVKDKVDNNYISNNSLKCLKIWIGLGVRYPGEYIKAYFDQTKGFWNGGYNYSTVGEYIADFYFNPGVKKISIFRFSSPAYILTNLFRFVPVFDMLISIGLYIWILLFAFVRNISKNNKKLSLILLPYVLLVITLWLTTPVYTQFRYSYPIIMGFPIIIYSIFLGDECVSQ